MADPKSHQVVIVFVPFIAQSHLNQLLQLSCLVSNRTTIPVHYTISATHIQQAILRFQNRETNTGFSKIHFDPLPNPDFTSQPPDPTHRAPIHLLPSWLATLQLREPVAALLRKISETTSRLVVVHDILMSYVVQDIPKNGTSYAFGPTSTFSTYFDTWQIRGKSWRLDEEPDDLPCIEQCYPPEFMKYMAIQYKFLKLASGFLYNTSRTVEGKYIDLLRNLKRAEGDKKLLWAIGPLHLTMNYSSTRHKCIDWLDMQPPKSVLYVSFGSITPLKDEQIVELAKGLQESKQKFIWVLKEADKGNIFEGSGDENPRKNSLLPEGYEEKVKGTGLIVKDWAPQEEILKHPSTGGFLSHCGWNSCLESVSFGVPIAAWPMHTDQPKNAFLVTNVLKMGLVAKRWEVEDKIVTASSVSEVVKRLMASKEGAEMRKRAEELSEATKKAVVDGGVSRIDFDAFVAHITTAI